jgi:hypothetical protein
MLQRRVQRQPVQLSSERASLVHALPKRGESLVKQDFDAVLVDYDLPDGKDTEIKYERGACDVAQEFYLGLLEKRFTLPEIQGCARAWMRRVIRSIAAEVALEIGERGPGRRRRGRRDQPPGRQETPGTPSEDGYQV